MKECVVEKVIVHGMMKNLLQGTETGKNQTNVLPQAEASV